MPWLPIPPRSDRPELMDGPGLAVAEVADAYRLLRRVNRQFFGSLRSLGRELDRFRVECGPLPPRLSALDLGAGSGDLTESIRTHLAAKGAHVVALALDRDPTALSLASAGGVTAVRGDALKLPFADCSVDLVTSIKFAHHFSGDSLTTLLAEMARVARRQVLVLDIRRDWLAYAGFIAWGRLFAPNRLVRNDGPISVLRGFTSAELASITPSHLDYSWTIRGHLGFQLALIGRRMGPPAGI